MRGGRRLGLVVLVALALVACGSGNDDDVAAGDDGGDGDSGEDGRPWTNRSWRAPQLTDDPTAIVLTYRGPSPDDGAECEEQPVATAEPSEPGVVAVWVKLFDDWADPSCPMVDQQITLTLDEPLGDRVLEEPSTGWRYRLSGDRLAVVPESTPCGRADCSTPALQPSPCDTATIRAAVDREIDGGIRLNGEPQCDGSFLVITIDTGSSGCPPTDGEGPSPCQNLSRAYFVAREGQWRIVTYAADLTCTAVDNSTHILFPTSMCTT